MHLKSQFRNQRTRYKLQKAFTVKPLAATHESEAFSIKYDGIGILKIYGL